MTAMPTSRLWILGLPAPRRLPPPPAGMDCPTLYDWARDHGAVATEITRHTLRVRAKRTSQYKLIAVHARVVRRTQVQSAGIDVTCAPAGYKPGEERGEEQQPQADLELELATPEEDRYQPDNNEPEVQLFAGQALTWHFEIHKPPGGGDTYYELDITYERNKRLRRLTINDNGKPFLLATRSDGMGYSPPQLKFERQPQPHFAYEPARCDPSPC